MDYSHRSSVPEFDLRNSSLSFLASEVAVDIENCIRGRSQEGESVRYLAQLLDRTTQGENPAVKYCDNSVVLCDAISGRENFERVWKYKSVDDVAVQVNLAAKDLRDFASLPRERQETLRDFCVRLSREVACNYSKYYSGRRRLVA